MNLEILPATLEQRPIMARLAELYLYDFSEFMSWDVDANGSFGDGDLDGCWTDPMRYTYLFKVDGKWAGFAILDNYQPPQDAEDYMDMAEFFVLRKFRRQGIGKQAARWLFDQFPGRRWRVAQLAENANALTFWTRIIAEYTGGNYENSTWQTTSHHGTVQFFKKG